MFENSVTYQFIANVDSGMDDTAGTITPNDLPEGSVGVFTLDGDSVQDQAGAGANDLIRVVGRKNGSLNFSPPFMTSVADIESSATEAAVEQVSYVGYNPEEDEGELDTLGNTSYVLGFRLNHTQGVYNNTPIVKSVPFWLSDMTGKDDGEIQRLLAEGLMKIHQKEFKRYPGEIIRADLTCDSDTSAPLYAGSATDMQVTNDSKEVIYTDGSGSAEANTNADKPDVGDYIVFDDDVVYKIVEVDGNDGFTIDRPYHGDTKEDSFDTTGDGEGTVDDPDAAATNWGLRFVGQTPEDYDPKLGPPSQISFSISLSRMLNRSDKEDGVNPLAEAPIVRQTAAYIGSGTYKQVAYQEVWTTMNEGNATISAYPPTKYSNAANPDNVYGTIVVNGADAGYTSAATGQAPVSKFTIIIQAATDAATGMTNDYGRLDTALNNAI